MKPSARGTCNACQMTRVSIVKTSISLALLSRLNNVKRESETDSACKCYRDTKRTEAQKMHSVAGCDVTLR